MIDKIREEAKSFLENTDGSHDWGHTERVYKLCMHIAEREQVDLNILKLAAILHDIGRPHQDKLKGSVCHAEKGAILSKDILEKYNLDPKEIDQIVHCIECHRFRGHKVPQSKEAKILFDADKLDAIGAVGIGRAFIFAGVNGAKLHNKEVDIEKTEEYTEEDTAFREFMVKLRKVKDRMLTEEGKKLAEERHNFMIKFFNRLNEEVDGNI